MTSDKGIGDAIYLWVGFAALVGGVCLLGVGAIAVIVYWLIVWLPPII